MLAGRWSALAGGRAIVEVGHVAEMKMLDKTEQPYLACQIIFEV